MCLCVVHESTGCVSVPVCVCAQEGRFSPQSMEKVRAQLNAEQREVLQLP